MIVKLNSFFILFFFLLFWACGSDNKNNDVDSQHSEITEDHISESPETDADVNTEKDINARLKPIRDNFTRINGVKNWTDIIEEEISETTEGGEAFFYFLSGQLEKIIERNYGETFQNLAEYYLLDGKLSFVYEKNYMYNRPIYYDSVNMIDNNDTEVFDFERSQISEDRSYFENRQLFHQIRSIKDSEELTRSYLAQEQKRITENYERLINMLKNK